MVNNNNFIVIFYYNFDKYKYFKKKQSKQCYEIDLVSYRVKTLIHSKFKMNFYEM